MTPSTSEGCIGTTIPESVRKWLHRAPIPGESWHDAAILFEAAENWAASCFPDSAQDMVDAFDSEPGSAMEWLDLMGYGPGPNWAETWPEYREGLHRMSISLKRTGIRYDAVIVPNGTEPALSVIGEGALTGTKGQVAAEMALLAAEDMLYGLCTQSVGPLQFELLKALDRAGRDCREPLLRQERPGPMDGERHRGLTAAFRALFDISNSILGEGSGTEPVACGSLSERFVRVEARDGPDMEAVDYLVSLVSLIPEDMLPLRTDGICLCFDGKGKDDLLRACKGPTWFEPLSRTVHADPESPSGLVCALACAFDFACGLCSASDSFDPTYEGFMEDLYGKPPELEKGTLKWYTARQEVFTRLYEHYLSRTSPGIEDICMGFGPDRKVSEDADVVLDEDVIFNGALPIVHDKIADGSRQLSLSVKEGRLGEDVLFDGREWTLSACLEYDGELCALLVPSTGNVSGPIAVKLQESVIFDDSVLEVHELAVMDLLLEQHSRLVDGGAGIDG